MPAPLLLEPPVLAPLLLEPPVLAPLLLELPPLALPPAPSGGHCRISQPQLPLARLRQRPVGPAIEPSAHSWLAKPSWGPHADLSHVSCELPPPEPLPPLWLEPAALGVPPVPAVSPSDNGVPAQAAASSGATAAEPSQ